MNESIRIDYGFAMLALMIARQGGNKEAQLKDFLLWGEPEEPTLKDVAKMLGVKRGR